MWPKKKFSYRMGPQEKKKYRLGRHLICQYQQLFRVLDEWSSWCDKNDSNDGNIVSSSWKPKWSLVDRTVVAMIGEAKTTCHPCISLKMSASLHLRRSAMENSTNPTFAHNKCYLNICTCSINKLRGFVSWKIKSCYCSWLFTCIYGIVAVDEHVFEFKKS